jgi:hypothetical protein
MKAFSTHVTLTEDEAITVREGLYLVLQGIGTGPIADVHRSRIERLIVHIDRLLSEGTGYPGSTSWRNFPVG